jgi:hypothetical protein
MTGKTCWIAHIPFWRPSSCELPGMSQDCYVNLPELCAIQLGWAATAQLFLLRPGVYFGVILAGP